MIVMGDQPERLVEILTAFRMSLVCSTVTR